jgi:hypothetical protein
METPMKSPWHLRLADDLNPNAKRTSMVCYRDSPVSKNDDSEPINRFDGKSSTSKSAKNRSAPQVVLSWEKITTDFTDGHGFFLIQSV